MARLEDIEDFEEHQISEDFQGNLKEWRNDPELRMITMETEVCLDVENQNLKRAPEQ